MRRLLVLPLLALIAGCAPRYYVAPTGDPSKLARVTIRSTSALALWPHVYEQPLTCAYIVRVSRGKPVAPGHDQAMVVARGVPLTLAGRYQAGGTGLKGCVVNATFLPEAADYTVTFDADERLDEGCRVQVRIGQGTDGPALAPPKLVVRGFSQPVFESGGWCPSMTEEQRRGLGLASLPERPVEPAQSP